MAIGLARMFGFHFKENFRYPYVAASITDFWRRWHISLSTWYRDYLYIPLGGNRGSTGRTYANLVTVFLLCGLWHGASWVFVAWGVFHGAFLVIERAFLGDWLARVWAPLRWSYALLVIMVGWVLFRATTLAHAGEYLAAMAGFGAGDGIRFSPALYLNTERNLALVAAVLASLPIVPWWNSAQDRVARALSPNRWMAAVLEPLYVFTPDVALMGLLLVSAMLLAGGTYNPFIYFRF
jgi:alginate O-acetyltransferase complex protein AlgI